jgi:hypothetical protein
MAGVGISVFDKAVDMTSEMAINDSVDSFPPGGNF